MTPLSEIIGRVDNEVSSAFIEKKDRFQSQAINVNYGGLGRIDDPCVSQIIFLTTLATLINDQDALLEESPLSARAIEVIPNLESTINNSLTTFLHGSWENSSNDVKLAILCALDSLNRSNKESQHENEVPVNSLSSELNNAETTDISYVPNLSASNGNYTNLSGLEEGRGVGK